MQKNIDDSITLWGPLRPTDIFDMCFRMFSTLPPSTPRLGNTLWRTCQARVA